MANPHNAHNIITSRKDLGMPCTFCHDWIHCTAVRPISAYILETSFRETDIMTVVTPTETKKFLVYGGAGLEIGWYRTTGPEEYVQIMVCDQCVERANVSIQNFYNDFSGGFRYAFQ